MITITATLNGTAIIDRQLAGLESRSRDMRPAYAELTRVFQRIVKKAFDTEGGSGDTGTWRPLAPATVEERRSLRAGPHRHLSYGPEHPILQRTLTLMRSLTETTSDTISAETESYYARGSAVPYVMRHQSTSTRTRRKIPRRPPVAFTQDQKSELFLPLRRHVTGRDPNAPTRGRIS